MTRSARVNLLSHYTDWTSAHVHFGALGWNGMITGALVYSPRRLWNRERLYSTRWFLALLARDDRHRALRPSMWVAGTGG